VRAGQGMEPFADTVETVVIPGAGHWVAEQAPREMAAALAPFLAPYRAAAGSRSPRSATAARLRQRTAPAMPASRTAAGGLQIGR
jgi:hypothetical protein